MVMQEDAGIFKAVGNPGYSIVRALVNMETVSSQVIFEEFNTLGFFLSTALARNTPIGTTGNLSLSTSHRVEGKSGTVELTISQDARGTRGVPYRPFVNMGVSPASPPHTDTLLEWVRIRFRLEGKELKRATFAVARKIATKRTEGGGTRPNPYTIRTVEESVDEIQKTANKIGQNLTVVLVDLVQIESLKIIKEDLRRK